jgi:hypothetical protein
MLVGANAWLETQFQTIIAAVFATAPGLKVHLATGSFNPTGVSTPAGFTEAAFTGYSVAALTTWNSAHLNSNGDILTVATLMANFTATGTLSSPVSITGYWCVDEAGTYVGGEAFIQPFSMISSLTPLTFPIGIPLRYGTYGTTIQP